MIIFNINQIEINLVEMQKYKKKRINLHVIQSVDIGTLGDIVMIKTLEGDVNIIVGEDNYIMIGAGNEVYPISKQLFDSKYQFIHSEEHFELNIKIQGKEVNPQWIKTCRLYVDSFIYAKKMEEEFAVITKNNYDAVLKGTAGDYLACSYENHENVYVIDGKLMIKTYMKCE